MANPPSLWRPSSPERVDPTSIDATGSTLGDVLTSVTDGSGGKRGGWAAPPAGGGGGGGSAVFVGARVYNNANISIANNTATALTFNSERFDTDAFHSTSANTSRFTIPAGKAGKYAIGGNVEWPSNSTGLRLIYIQLNGATPLASTGPQAANGSLSHCNVNTVYDLAAGDYVELIVYQLSGGNLNANASGNYSPEFWLHFVGPSGSTVGPEICCGRLTLESGVPMSTTDQTGKTTVYFTPYKGARISLYDGSATWATLSFAETSLALGTLTSGKNYDVFGYNNAGTLALELSAAWTNDTTRADALVLQDGVYVKSGATTRRHLGTIRTTSTTTTEDSAAKRFVWNRYNQRARAMVNATETANNWNDPGTSTYRQANANTANQLDYVTGDVETYIEAMVIGMMSMSTITNALVGIGVDSTSANSAQYHGTNTPGVLNAAMQTAATYRGNPGLGRHFLAWLEYGANNGIVWFGDAGNATAFQFGITGTIWN